MSPTMRERFSHAAATLLAESQDVALVLADIGVDRFREAIQRHPGRVLNVGIREQVMIGVGAGLALEDFRPILHTYAPFLVERAFEQIKISICHQGLGAVLVSVGASYDWAAGGRTHHAPGDVALLSTLPGMRIHVPGHPDEVEHILRREIATLDPVYIRLSETSNATSRVSSSDRFQVVRERSGARATVVAVGPMLDPVLEAAADLPLDVLYAQCVRPFDAATLRNRIGSVVAESGPTAAAVLLVEPYMEGTSAAEVADALADLPHRLLSIGVPKVEHRRYGTAEDHDRAYGLDASGLSQRFEAFLSSPVT